MSLKDNFNQAVKELLKRDGLVGSDLSKGAKQKSELDRYLDTPPQTAGEPQAKTAPVEEDIPPMPQNTAADPFSRAASDLGAGALGAAALGAAASGAGVFSGNVGTPGQTPPAPPKTPPFPPQQPQEPPYFETEETTVISRNTIIDGNIRSFANINVEGSVKGDVQISKNANLSGKVVGDLTCNNAVMVGSSMQGNVLSKGQVKLDRDSLILGDIAAQYLDMNGKIKGNVDIGGKAEFKTDAIIFGNINAATITVLDGATIQGFVNTTFLQETNTNIFPESIAVSE